MSKNISRKGMALGALVALGTTLFAGAPAFADDKVVFTADYAHDKSTNVPMDYYIELTASLAPHSTAANIAQLSYAITAPDGVALNYWNNDYDDYYTADGSAFNISNGSNSDTGMGYTPSATTHNYLGLELRSPDITDDTISVTVKAYIDSDVSGTYTEGEASQTLTVKFVKYSELTTSSKFTAPIIEDDTETTVDFSFTNVNNEAINDNHGSFATGAELTTGTGSYLNNWYDNGPGYDSTLNGWEFDGFGLGGSADADTAVKFHPWLYSDDEDDFIDVGTVISTDVVSRTVGDVQISAVRSLTAKGGTGDTEFQTNSTFQQKITVTNTDGDPLAGAPVTIGVYDYNFDLSSTKTLTINGTTYTADNKLPDNASGVAKLSVGTTNADGEITVTFTTKGFADNNGFYVDAYAENQSDEVYAYANDSYYFAYPTNYGASDSNCCNGILNNNQVAGGTTTVNVTVQDQYGALAPNNTFEVTAELDDWDGYSTDPTNAGSDTHSAVVGGKATLSIKPNGKSAEGDTAYFDLYLLAKAANGSLSDSSPDVNFNDYISYLNVNTVAAADLVVGKVVVTNGAKGTDGVYALNAGQRGASNNKQNLDTKDFANWDERTSLADEPETNGGYAVIEGSVKTTSTTTYASVNIPNALVTISAPGVMFEGCGGLVDEWESTCTWQYGADTLSIYADYAGNFAFQANSHLAGKQTATITVNGVSSKVYLNFNNAAITAAKNVAVKVADGAAQFQAGRALDVLVTVTDKFGNPIVVSDDSVAKLKLTQSGVGYLGQTVDGTLDDAGTATNKLITSTGDLGTSTLTAKLDFVSSDYDDISTTVSSELGVTDVADISVGGRAVYAQVEFAKGKTVTVIVDGKKIYSKVQTSDNYTELKFTQKKAGKHVVTVRISGGVFATETVVTTKK